LKRERERERERDIVRELIMMMMMMMDDDDDYNYDYNYDYDYDYVIVIVIVPGCLSRWDAQRLHTGYTQLREVLGCMSQRSLHNENSCEDNPRTETDVPATRIWYS
jgi:hypothetical protein